jgi:hypothetical protein
MSYIQDVKEFNLYWYLISDCDSRHDLGHRKPSHVVSATEGGVDSALYLMADADQIPKGE